MKIVKFYADWCPPCKAYNGVWNAMKEKHQQHDWTEVNIDDNEQAHKTLERVTGKSSIPCTYFISDEGYVDFAKGPLTEDQIERRL